MGGTPVWVPAPRPERHSNSELLKVSRAASSSHHALVSTSPVAAFSLQRLAGNSAVAGILKVQRCGSTPPDQCPCQDGDHSGGQAASTGSRHPAATLEQQVQRQDRPSDRRTQAESSSLTQDDPRLDDPGFLICTAFCFLGVPPSAFKDLIQSMLECISSEMRAAGHADYDRRFRAAGEELAGYSKVRLLGKALRFLMHGELGPGGIIRVTARSQAIRDRVLGHLLVMGASRAGLVAAEAVVRRVLLVIDAVIAVGCATYCGAMQIGQRIVEFSEAVAQGIAGAVAVLSGIGDAIAGALNDAVLSAYGQLNPLNWSLSSSLPDRTRADLSMIGLTMWSQVRPGSPWTARRPDQTEADSMLANAATPLSRYVPRDLMTSVAAAVQASLSQSGSSAQVTTDHLLGMSPVGLVIFLRDNGLLTFRTDPIDFANADLNTAEARVPVAP